MSGRLHGLPQARGEKIGRHGEAEMGEFEIADGAALAKHFITARDV